MTMYQKTKVLKAKKAPKKPAERKPLTNEQRAEQRAKASCCMVVEFINPVIIGGREVNNFKKWSNEWQQPHKGGLNEWVNQLMYIFDIHWKNNTKSAAIFDTRFQKTLIGSERDPNSNKLYQFENRVWRAVK
ncbi:hypothetical protein GVN20_24780 [Runella sp. CRIBMP]|uniref:hypothetical protein n=1 Tax=Runella sp. CRIBMP TaxID=2683261 RepID=UPI001412D43A|nr:hypothetical protein [Runella sp. CRIBMP]NBB22593.1 hypothetical protein [Runella sp. CRIBMP]